MGPEEYADLAIMMNMGHHALATYINGVDFGLERDAIIRQMKRGMRELIAALKVELPGAAVWICAEACVHFDQCRECHRSDHPMFRIYHERAHLDDEEMQRIRGRIANLVERLLPLPEGQQKAVIDDIAQVRMIGTG